MFKKIFGLLFLFSAMCMSCNRTAEKNDQAADTISPILLDTKALQLDTLATNVDSSITEETLQDAILAITHAFNSNNSKALNAYIDKKIGFYTIYRPGVQEVYQHATKIDFNRPIPEYYPYSKSDFKGKLTFAQLPIYDCGKEVWSKKGLFCDQKKHPHELAQTAKYMNDLLDSNIPASTIQTLKQLEAQSYRVILTEGDEPLIFHITRNSEKWILTVLDRAYGGCDA